jgi:GTP cyclohydrolase I
MTKQENTELNQELTSNINSLLEAVGEDPSRDGLIKTPTRFLKAFKFLTQGYEKNPVEIIQQALFEADYSEMVIVKNIELYSLCEHHLLPFFGKCHVAYIPNGRIIGLSKIPRLVDAFARRLQVQERLTSQIAQALMDHLNPLGVGVVMEASHLCMMMRGVEKQNSFTTTSALLGDFRNPATRTEFFNLIK